MRADISAIMNFLGMSDKKHKSHNDVNKQGKAQASLAITKKSKRSEKKVVATSFQRKYVDEEDSAESDADHNVQRFKWNMRCLPKSRLHPRPSSLFNRFLDKTPAVAVAERLRQAYPTLLEWAGVGPTPTHKTCLLSAVGDLK